MKNVMNKNMKSTIAILLSTLSLQSFAIEPKNGLVDISRSIYPTINEQIASQVDGRFYINVPQNKWMSIDQAIKPLPGASSVAEPIIAMTYKITEKSLNKTLPMGLRVFAANNGNGSVAQRYKVADALGKSGVIQTGDILLTYRPYWSESIKYAHIQMGISHAGMAYVDDAGSVRNMDMPLNEEMFDASGMNKMSSSHYVDANGMFVHILRPRLVGNEQANLREWAKLMVTNVKKQYRGNITFNLDYGAPNYDAAKPGDLTFVKDLAKMGLGKSPSQKRTMYCSEFVWSVLSLKKCDPKVLAASSNLDSALNNCIQKIYEPMPVLADNMAGMAEGPRALIAAINETNQKLTKEEEYKLLQSVFTSASPDPNASVKISNGHKAIDKELTAAKFYDGLMAYYLNDDPTFRAQMKMGINPTQKANYSPTSLMINSTLPDSQRVFDYVGTLTYTPEPLYKSILKMSKSLN